MRSELISIAKLDTLASLCGLNIYLQKTIYFSVSIKDGLRTADCGLGIKYGLGIKRGLRTEYKTRTRYKTRTTDYVYKNSFRR